MGTNRDRCHHRSDRLRSSRVTRTRTRLAALAAVAVVALSGCASLHPGVAIEVGDQSISNPDIDSLSRDLCTTLKSDQRLIQGGFATSSVLASTAQSWVLRSVASQMAEQYDVVPTASYNQAVDQTRLQFATLDPDLLDRVIDTWTGTAYFVSILTAVGAKELEAAGQSNPSDDESLTKGIELAQAWEDDHGITLAPRFPAMTISDTHITTTRDETSYALSDFAKQAAADQPDAAYVKALPPSQRCGG